MIKLRTAVYTTVAAATLGWAFTHTSTLSQLFLKSATASISQAANAATVAAPNIQYGFNLDSFQVEHNTISSNEFFGQILLRHGVSYNNIETIVKQAKDVFDIRKFNAGKPYLVLSKNQNGTKTAQYFIYDSAPYYYVLFDLVNNTVQKIERPIEQKVKNVSGVVTSSLWESFGEEIPYELILKLQDVFGWTVDFHHVKLGDKFKIIYEEKFIEGNRVGIGNIRAAIFNHEGKDYYSFHYRNDTTVMGYYDQEGRPMKKAFLQAPVKNVRITSGFNMRRLHPILGYHRPHYGTDYAAPTGTPILAIGEGTIERMGYERGNGNFVKVKHDKTYASQYLHMSRFPKGLRTGSHVTQGQVIGYVGSTGLATGPHVCFRFWKNGAQVDHRKEKLPPPQTMLKENMDEFNALRDSLIAELAQTPYPNETTETIPTETHEP